MLFWVKIRWEPALACGALLGALGWISARALGIPWELNVSRTALEQVLVGLAAILASDLLLHLLLRRWFGEPYRRRFASQLAYFDQQDTAAILASGPCAAAEETVFRGVLLPLLLPLGSGPAVAVSALAFGLGHWRRDGWARPFNVWACWQGVVLGLLYLWTGNLAVNLMVHGLHDVLGFAVFRLQRRSGLLL